MAGKPTRVVVPVRKARNPLVVAARFRHAGAHGKSGKAKRQQGRQRLEHDLAAILAGDKPESDSD